MMAMLVGGVIIGACTVGAAWCAYELWQTVLDVEFGPERRVY